MRYSQADMSLSFRQMASAGPQESGDVQAQNDPSHREALVDAFTRLASAQGYRSLGEDEIAHGAGLGIADFRVHFPTTRHCLLAAHDVFFERIVRDVKADCRHIESWSHRVAAALAVTLCHLDETASRARLFIVDAVGAGPAVLERRFAITGRLAVWLAEGRRYYCAAATLPDATEWMLISGAIARITAALLEERPGLLPALQLELTELLLTPYMGPADARRVATESVPS